jgi:hypothetical protein
MSGYSSDREVDTPPERLDFGLSAPYDVLLGRIDRVIAAWRSHVQREPWSSIPEPRLVDSFPEILPKLLRLASVGANQVDEELRELIADQHGLFRRADTVPLVAVAEEWSHLRRACAQVLSEHGITGDEASAAMRRLEVLIDDAIGYTLRGYYRPELDSLKGRGLERREGPVDRRKGEPDRRRDGDLDR